VLIFRTVTWRNFLSTGNATTTLNLDSNDSTLIVGKNGEGKSTMLDALTFALFGKPFRDVNKNQLINSINKKNCEVTVEFELNARSYKIIRGIKPNIFEIYCDGQLINQDAALKDYQKVLEQQILRLNYKTFTQVIILGSSSFVPFMQLPQGQRREVIEDILDIRIFSVMNQLLKEKMAKTKESISAIETEIRIIAEQAKSQQRILETMQGAKDKSVKAIQDKIQANKTEIQNRIALLETLHAKHKELAAQLPDSDKLKKDHELIQKNWSKYEALTDQLDGQMAFFDADTCPACQQNIEHTHKDTILTDMLTKKEEYLASMATIKAAQEKLTKTMTDTNELARQITDLSIDTSTETNAIYMLNTTNAELEKELAEENESGDIVGEKEKLKQIASEALNKNLNKIDLARNQKIEEASSALLKDTGIKTAIIREYLPIMNKLINKYLTAMDFFVHFELDEGFNEVIKSRHRDEFTYASFSEGEKQKIDLALLFAWRQIAKMKNSVNTNLLIMDEIFDSSLDTAGTEMLMNLLYELPQGHNVFVISHKGDVLVDKFENVVKFEKKNEFSVITKN
jgi:DNA repair exonuclease SbcCD ATPase subunit